ncbi:hypothetical protein [Moritella sp. F3]|uniref:hypothetical protein n=1 Tax=Moritella sp. F3 TaxID=2718882 RepID=UPI0018E18C6A|nr:hypothetical protein [Moritella sp. F3]GIC77112.1 hypothetical protein FMO001_18390 [Moritella sp. F1]GIC82231.1 hypothetical protein FMO003_25120 [Moritella sp. F3]
MSTLDDARKLIQNKLSPHFLSVVVTEKGKGVMGNELVALVNEINNELLNIKMAINIFGADFAIPVSDLKIGKEHRSLFAGVHTWRQHSSHFYTEKNLAKPVNLISKTLNEKHIKTSIDLGTTL